MKRTACLTLFATLTVACAANQDTPPPVTTDTGVVTDSPVDSGSDTPAETPTVCKEGDIESRACGKCGKQSHVCLGTSWGDWKACQDELNTAECSIGDTRSSDCGNCGKSADICDPVACTWTTGACTGEGPCAPADIEKTTASCTVAGEIRVRTCGDTCKWSDFSACALPKGWVKAKAPPTGFVGRYGHAAIYTGTLPILWGGEAVDSFGDTNALADGASYDVAADSWTLLPAAPTVLSAGRMFPCGVYSGSQMLIWGGAEGVGEFILKGDGARYDPATSKWSSMSSVGAPSARFGAGAVWSTTTKEMIVWGGCKVVDTWGTCTTFAADGAAYDPVKDTWTALPAAPSGFVGRSGHSMEWSGTEVVIWGGADDTTELGDGIRYDPSAKTWTTIPAAPTGFGGRIGHVSVFSGKELMIYGGADLSYTVFSSGARYTPSGGWSLFSVPSSSVLPTPARQTAQGWYGASKLWVWSGIDDSYTALKGGASYDATLDTWTAMDATDEPAARGQASTLWTGKEAFIWGGTDPSSGAALADGAIYRP